MKTNQKLEITFDGLIFSQDMHLKMIYVNELEVEILKFTGLLDKRFNIFMSRKDTKEFIAVLKYSENLKDHQIIFGRGKTKRIHHLLAFKFATWVSKEFEIKVYKFFIEHYPEIRELGGDQYNNFKENFLPKIYEGNSANWVVINMNVYINSVLKKDNGWNKQSKLEYKARNYIYSHIMLDIERGIKPKSRQLISDFINKRIDYHFESLKILNTFIY
ncbi:MAG: KilA-N domain-containing protein [Methylococcales bacterium]|nr:KilA-N domain-containing protein [Methylococcales bacterium]